MIEKKENEKKGVGNGTDKESRGDNSVFASCSFSSLGLHPTLCDQLRGIYLFLIFYLSLCFVNLVANVLNHDSAHGHAAIVQSFNLLRLFCLLVCLFIGIKHFDFDVFFLVWCFFSQKGWALKFQHWCKLKPFL